LAANPYRAQRILDALRAGEAVGVPAWAEPKSVRAEINEAARQFPTGSGRRMVVHPDDTFSVIAADSATCFLEDYGL
jgi:hypothetical protein